MSSNGSALKRLFNPTASSPDYLAPIAPTVFDQEVTFPRFPTLQEQLAHLNGTAPHPLMEVGVAPPPPDRSLFQGLLGGRLDVLQQDVQENPDRYDEATRAVFAELSSGAKTVESLDPVARKALDRATLDFASYRPPRTAARSEPSKPPPAPKKPRLLYDGVLEDGRAPQVEEPGGPMTAYWWLT
jgi:hypothetical protein